MFSVKGFRPLASNYSNTQQEQTMKKAELIKQVEAAMKQKRALADSLEGTTNPQSIKTLERCDGMADAFEAVLEALKGDPVLLGIWAKPE